METTRFQEALTAFNEKVKKIAEIVRNQMEEIELDEIDGYKLITKKVQGCTKKYLAVCVEKYEGYQVYKSLEDSRSEYYLYNSDVWIEAATVDEKMDFLQGVAKMLSDIDAERTGKIVRMSMCVSFAEENIGLQQVDDNVEGGAR